MTLTETAPRPAPSGRRSAPPVLARARALTRPVTERAVAALHPDIQRVVAYHLGWRTADGSPSTADAGKGLRPALALLSAEAAGAPEELGTLGGAAVELVHNFSLLHDDVMDDDRERRHRPTAWAVFGVPAAVLAGDALLACSQELLLDAPGEAGRDAALALTRATAAMIAGQADDMAFENAAGVTPAQCLAMEAAKTGAILACAASIGAVLAGAETRVVDALAGYGLHLGQAFQAIDDLLGIWGDPARTGKPVANDLRQHKKTLPVVTALSGAATAERRELAGLLASPTLDGAGVARAVVLLEACGGREQTMAEARRHADAALTALAEAPLRPGPVTELAELALYLTERER